LPILYTNVAWADDTMTETTPTASPKALFLAAQDIADAAERSVYLQTACAGNADLLQRVEGLLMASTKAESADFLANTAGAEQS
jgi:hypothetical protein